MSSTSKDKGKGKAAAPEKRKRRGASDSDDEFVASEESEEQVDSDAANSISDDSDSNAAADKPTASSSKPPKKKQKPAPKRERRRSSRTSSGVTKPTALAAAALDDLADSGSDDDDNAPILKKTKPRKKRATQKEMDAVKAAATPSVWNDSPLVWQDVRSVEFLERGNQPYDLKNLRRIKDALDATLRIRRVAATGGAEAPQALDTIFALPLIPGHQLTVWLSCEKKGWAVEMKDSGKTPFWTKKKTVRCPFSLVPKDDRATARKVADTFANLLQRNPYTVSPRLMQMLMRTAALHHSPGSGRDVAYPTRGESKGGSHGGVAAYLNLRIINPDTNEAEVATRLIHPVTFQNTDNDKEIPDAPSDVRFTRAGQGSHWNDQVAGDVAQITGDDGTLEWPAIFTSADVKGKNTKQVLLRTERFARFLAAKLDGTICSRTQLDNLIDIYCKAFGGVRRGVHGIYGGSPIFRLHRDQKKHTIAITQSGAVRKDLGWPNHVRTYIYSLNANRTVSCIDAGVQVFLRSPNDVRLALVECAIEADRVNNDIQSGEPAADFCVCSYDMSLLVLHPCGICLGLSVCSTRGWSSRANMLVCSGCLMADAAHDKPSDARLRIIDTLKIRFRSECRMLDEDYGTLKNQDIYKNALHQLYEKALKGVPSGWTYRNSYAAPDAPAQGYGSTAAEVVATKLSWTGARKDPFSPSCDASLPYMAVLDYLSEEFRVHCVDNVEVMPAWLNYAKYTHLPGVIAEVADYFRLPTPRSPAQKLALYEILTELYKIRLKSPYKRQCRQEQEFDAEKYAEDIDEMVSGRLTNDAPEDFYGELFRFNIAPVTGGDDEEDWDDVDNWHARRLRICREIRDKFHATMTFADDGAPWFGPGPMPQRWGWGRWKVICRQRFERMRWICNRHHDVVDTPETLFLEIFYQLCSDEAEYEEFFDLPRVVYIRHPLCLSIGHKVHGKRMSTGWSANPKSLADRVNDNNNILIETWFSNIAKQSYHESFYDAMKKSMKTTVVPDSLYNKARATKQTVDADMRKTLAEAKQEVEEVVGTSAEVDDEAVDAMAEADGTTHLAENDNLVSDDDDDAGAGTGV